MVLKVFTKSRQWCETHHHRQQFRPLKAAGLLNVSNIICLLFFPSNRSLLCLWSHLLSLFGLPLLRFLPYSAPSVHFLAHRSFAILPMWLSRPHSIDFTLAMISATPVCSRTQSFLFLSLCVIFNWQLAIVMQVYLSKTMFLHLKTMFLRRKSSLELRYCQLPFFWDKMVFCVS